jgi:hypothetical protein
VIPDTKGLPDGLLDYLLMGGSLSFVLGTIITVIISYYCCYYSAITLVLLLCHCYFSNNVYQRTML